MLLCAAGLAGVSGCHLFHGHPTPGATAVVRSASGDSLGVLSFYGGDADDGVHIKGTLAGLRAGVHGIHLHAVGSCTGPAFTSAGPHINPNSMHHGLDNPQGPHAGDLPNMTVGSNGVANVDVTTKRVSLAALKDADGSAIVVHADPDDQRSDPAGNSGARVACGVIQ
jgi:superoxide dismutase, Cu-Zn family